MKTECTCHPGREVVAFGLCGTCYKRRRRQTNPKYAEQHRLMRKRWRENNPEKIRAYGRMYRKTPRGRALHTEMARRARLKRYGLLEIQINELKEQQGYKCKICNKKSPLVLDHDHKTGAFRGLLCSKCNTGLGMFQDNTIILKRATEYLTKSEGFIIHPSSPEEVVEPEGN